MWEYPLCPECGGYLSDKYADGDYDINDNFIETIEMECDDCHREYEFKLAHNKYELNTELTDGIYLYHDMEKDRVKTEDDAGTSFWGDASAQVTQSSSSVSTDTSFWDENPRANVSEKQSAEPSTSFWGDSGAKGTVTSFW